MPWELAFFGDAVGDAAFEFRVQRQHGAKSFAERSEIVVGNPAPGAQKLLIEHWSDVEHTQDDLSCDRWFAVVQFNHDAGKALLAERHEHAAADHGSGLGRDTVGEDHVERHGQGNVAVLGHYFQGVAVSENSSDAGRTGAADLTRQLFLEARSPGTS